MIPAQAVETAAKEAAEADLQKWHELSERDQHWWEWITKHALEAAAPHMLAAAWEQGYMFSYDQERGGNGELPIPVPEYLADDLTHWNPYRTPDAV